MLHAEVSITLIHGTFSPEAEWVQEGSAFRKHLQNALDQRGIQVHFDPFSWSGKNDHQARLQAASQLAAHLTDDPAPRRFIVAHSHGGNAALHAFRQLTDAEGIKGVITLGTPFVSSRPREVTDRFNWSLPYFGLMVMIIPISFVLAVKALILRQFHMDPASWWFRVFMVVLMLGLPGPSAYYYLLKVTPGNLREWAKACQTRLAATLAMENVPLPPLLCLTTNDDEAARWLDLVRVLSSIPEILYGWLSSSANFMTGATTLLLLISLGVWVSGHHALGKLAFKVSLFPTVALFTLGTLLQICAALLPIVVRSHRFGFGGERITDNWFSDIIATATPVGHLCEVMNLSKVRSQGSGLKHSSFFTEPEFSIVIATWMEKILRSSPIPYA